MAVYTNTVADPNIKTSVGATTIIAGDVINLIEGTINYDTNLSALGTTQFATFMAGPGFSGNIGAYPAGLLVVAQNIYIESKSPMVALEGDNQALTVTALLVWKNLVGGKLVVDKYKDLTRMDLLASGQVHVLGTTNVDNAYVMAGGLTATFEQGGDPIVILDVGVPKGKNGSARAIVARDVTTLNIRDRGEAATSDDCSPTTVNNDNGTLRHAGGNIGTINTSGGVFDFSQVQADISAITWAITGDITIINPPTGISVDMPTAGEQGSSRIEYKDAA